MTLSFSIGKIAGIDIRIHLTLFLVLPILSYFFFSTPYPYGFRNVEPENLRILVSIIATFSLFASVLIHELSHSLLSKKYGVKVKGIVLFVFGGVSLLEDVPSETEKEVIIAAAGPLTSLLVAIFGYIMAKIGIFPVFFTVFGNLNLILAAFNLIPAFPLDGGRILRGLMAKSVSFVKATKIAASIGKALAVGMGVLGLFTSSWLILIALFIYIGANEEEKMALVENILKKVKISEIMTRNPICVSPEARSGEVLEMMLKYKHLGYPVIKNGKLVGIVTLSDLVKSKDAKVEDVMSKEVVTVEPEDSALKAFRLMNEYRIGRLPVVKKGELVGIISRTDLMRTLEILGAMENE